MACGFYRVRGLGAMHINFGRRKAPPACVHCGGISSVLCDHPGCDQPLCEACAFSVPGNRDYCPRHAAAHRSETSARLPFEMMEEPTEC